MQEVIYNRNGQIQVFINQGYDVYVISDIDQQLTLKLQEVATSLFCFTSIVYAKCDINLRLQEDLSNIAQGIDQRCIVRGDFNVVLNGEEKIGVCLPQMLILMILDLSLRYDLTQMSLKGSPDTRWNGRTSID